MLRKFSMDALDDFEDDCLDFVYIDANHGFDYVMSDILGWVKKVKKGGIIAGHDYVRSVKGKEVKDAVDVYVKCHELHLHVIEDKDEGASWWFRKQWGT